MLLKKASSNCNYNKTLKQSLVMSQKILFYLCLTLIIFLSIIPQNSHPSDPAFFSKVMFTKSGFFQHVLGYLVLGSLGWQVFKKNNIWLVFVGIVFLGVVLEFIQYGLPTRTFNFYDILANLTGVVIAFGSHMMLLVLRILK